MYPIKTKFRVKKLKKTFHQSVPIFAGEYGHDEMKKSRFIMFSSVCNIFWNICPL